MLSLSPENLGVCIGLLIGNYVLVKEPDLTLMGSDVRLKMKKLS
jgi:hypothetical protein